MKGFLIVICMITCLLGQAQQFLVIEGQIRDGASNSPLPFCSVFVKGREIGTVANFEGRFKINIPESMQSDTLVISHVGYKNYYAIVGELSEEITVQLEEAPIDLDVVKISTDRLTAKEIFGKAIAKINSGKDYPDQDFRMDGFFREQHRSEGVRTGVLECAISVFDDDVTTKFKDITINQFRKVYDRKQNTDQFIDTKEGHNHLLLLLNGGINLIPLAKRYKSSVWKLPLEIMELTYYNDRMVYVLANESERRKLRLYVDVEDFTVYKNELILEAKDTDYESYAWRKMNSKGEECGAVYDHQSYEYRSINGKLFPYYSFRRMDFRCFDLQREAIVATAQLKKELLVNHVAYNPMVTAKDKLRKKQGLINRKEPYDSVFWKHFNDISELDLDVIFHKGQHANAIQNMTINPAATVKEARTERSLHIGDHAAGIFTRADTLYGTLTPDLTCYDVYHYELDLDIDPAQEVISEEVTMNFQVLKGTHEIRLDLLEHMTIDEITQNGERLPFRRDLDAVYVSFEEGLLPRGKYSIKIRYQGHPLATTFGDQWTGGFMWSQDSEGNPFSQTLCQGYGAKGWFPVKNHLSDEPDSVDIKVTVPSNLVAVANGQLVKKKVLANTNQYHWKTTNPINSYDIAVHLGIYENTNSTFQSVTGAALIVDHYFLPQDVELAEKNLEMVPKMLEVYERYFGPYPFQEDGFKLVQSPYPMEHQSCVAVGPYFDDFLILHETAHEWWGNNVSITDNADIWINEAFATYAESLYLEATLGYETGQRYLNSRKGEILNDHTILGVRHVNHFHYRIEDKYTKGSLMINTLRQLVNDDELWFETMKDIQEDFRHAFIDTETLIHFMELQLEMYLSSFFEQYLRTTEIPILELKHNDTGFSYRWMNTVDGFNMPLRIGEVEIMPTAEWQQATIDLGQNFRKKLMDAYLIQVIAPGD